MFPKEVISGPEDFEYLKECMERARKIPEDEKKIYRDRIAEVEFQRTRYTRLLDIQPAVILAAFAAIIATFAFVQGLPDWARNLGLLIVLLALIFISKKAAAKRKELVKKDEILQQIIQRNYDVLLGRPRK